MPWYISVRMPLGTADTHLLCTAATLPPLPAVSQASLLARTGAAAHSRHSAHHGAQCNHGGWARKGMNPGWPLYSSHDPLSLGEDGLRVEQGCGSRSELCFAHHTPAHCRWHASRSTCWSACCCQAQCQPCPSTQRRWSREFAGAQTCGCCQSIHGCTWLHMLAHVSCVC